MGANCSDQHSQAVEVKGRTGKKDCCTFDELQNELVLLVPALHPANDLEKAQPDNAALWRDLEAVHERLKCQSQVLDEQQNKFSEIQNRLEQNRRDMQAAATKLQNDNKNNKKK